MARSVTNSATNAHAAYLDQPANLRAYWGVLLDRKRDREAIDFIVACAVAGSSEAQHLLGLMFLHGNGVRRSRSKSLRWLDRAAKNGRAEARTYSDAIQTDHHPFPFITTAALILWLFIMYARWQTGERDHAPALAVLAAIVLRLCFKFVQTTGRWSQARLFDQFAAALRERRRLVRIGGVRWTVSDGGIWRVVHSGNGILFDGKSSGGQRVQSELSLEALRILIAQASTMIAIVGGLLRLDQPASMWVAWAILADCLLLFCVIWEAIYRQGFQAMPGAMVLEPGVGELDREQVQQQQVHGDARLASPAEALTAAGGSAAPSPVHRQEF